MEEKVTFKQLEIFVSVVVAGSITKASRRVGLSQPSISQQLAKVEENLGAQLILRKRAGQVELTSAGEFWFKSASDLLRRYNAALEHHTSRFAEGNLTIRLGSPPTFRGRLAGAVARIALAEDRFARFEQFWGANSDEVVERLRMHQLNCALVNAESIELDRSSYSVTPLFDDTVAWVVPEEVPLPAIREAMAGQRSAFRDHPALARYVALGAGSPLQPASDDWYRHHLPFATQVFRTMTYMSAVELVSEGLATTHCPLSLVPNLPASAHHGLRWFKIECLRRQVVLAMPKHLLTLPPYARVHERVRQFADREYRQEMALTTLGSISSVA